MVKCWACVLLLLASLVVGCSEKGKGQGENKAVIEDGSSDQSEAVKS